jgi:hypothetical protein
VTSDGAPSPSASPLAINAMPPHTAAAGIAPVTGTPITAAATGATPVSSPALAEPNEWTHEYHRMNATAVTPTARYVIASRSPMSKLLTGHQPSVLTPKTQNIVEASHVV